MAMPNNRPPLSDRVVRDPDFDLIHHAGVLVVQEQLSFYADARIGRNRLPELFQTVRIYCSLILALKLSCRSLGPAIKPKSRMLRRSIHFDGQECTGTALRKEWIYRPQYPTFPATDCL
jgi:hypothetical protein